MGVTRLVHRTEYSYSRPVLLGPQTVRLRPMPHPLFAPLSYALTVEPAPASLHWQVDPEGNQVARLVSGAATERLVLEVVLDLALAPRNPFDFLLAPEAAGFPFGYGPEASDGLEPYRRAEPAGPLLAGLLARTGTAGPTVDWLLALAGAVVAGIGYVIREDPGVWTPERTLAEGRGSCRDSAWVLVQALRSHGVAARFVSGYLLHPPEDETPRGSELHAWAEAYLPGAGWVGVDATSGLLTAESHVGLAAAAAPDGAAPLTGTVAAAAVRLETSIHLSELGG